MNRREFLVAAAALAAVPEALARAPRPLALVTADLESHVAVVELETGRIVKRIRTVAGPRAIERIGEFAVVCHTEHGALSVVDGATLRVRDVVGGVEQPRYAANARDGRHAYVTDSAAGQLVVLDVERARIVGRAELGGPARHLSYEPSGRVVWVSLGNKAERVAAVDVATPRRPRLLRTFTPPFLAHDVGFGPGRVWVTAGASHDLVVYDGRGGVVRLAADAAPQHVTFVGRYAFVTSGDSGTLRVHDARTGALVRTTRIPAGSYNVQEAGTRILTPSLSRGTLCIADRAGRLVRRVQVARSSHDACSVLGR